MKPQATRIQPTSSAHARGEIIGVLLLAVCAGVGAAAAHFMLWRIMS